MAASTSTPSNSTSVVQGLLSSLAPWLTGGSPADATTQYGGPSLLGAELLANSGPPTTTGAMLGRALLGAQQGALSQAAQRQQLAQGSIAAQKSAMMLPFLRAYYQAALGGSGAAPNASTAASGAQTPSAGGSGQTAAQGASGASSGAPMMRQSAAPIVSGLGSAAGPGPSSSPFTIPSPASIAAQPVGGYSPSFLRLGGIMSGQSPLKTATDLRQQQLAVAQQQYGPMIAQLDTIDKAQSPTQYVQANPQLMSEWNQLAPSLGYDAGKDFTDPNVRTAFTYLRNRIAGALTLPTVAPPVQAITSRGPLGSIFSRNPITNALTQVKPEEALKPTVLPNGRVVNLSASQAAGQTPYESDLYVPPQAIQGTAKLIASYEMPPLSGYSLRSPIGAQIMAAVKKLNPQYDATTYQTKQVAREKFATGKQGDIVRSLSVATNHLDQLSQAADALAQHDTPAVNRLVNAVGVHITGTNAQTNFDAMKEIVGDEVVKAVVGATGAEGDREAIKDAFNAARSPQQIQGVIQKYESLMGGQLAGLKRQYQKATGLTDFNNFLSQQAQQQLTGGTTPQALGVGQSASMGGFTVTRVK